MWIVPVMRVVFALFAAVAALAPAGVVAQERQRDSDNAYRAVRQGDILPLAVIRDRVRVPGARLIGADLIADGTRYRLRFMRGPNVIWVDVDARTGRVVGTLGL